MNLGGEKKGGMGSKNKRKGTKMGWQSEHRELISQTRVQSRWSSRLLLERGNGEGGGERKDFDFIWQPETPSHSLYQKRARSVERALPQNQYRHKEPGDRDKGSDRCGKRNFKIQVERKGEWRNKKMQRGERKTRMHGKEERRGKIAAGILSAGQARIRRWVWGCWLGSGAKGAHFLARCTDVSRSESVLTQHQYSLIQLVIP